MIKTNHIFYGIIDPNPKEEKTVDRSVKGLVAKFIKNFEVADEPSCCNLALAAEEAKEQVHPREPASLDFLDAQQLKLAVK